MQRYRLAALLLLLFLFARPAGAAAERIDQIFTDPRIAARVAFELSKEPADDVTQAELNSVTYLYAEDVVNWESLDRLTKLEHLELYLDDSFTGDLSMLEGLTSLKFILVNGVNLSGNLSSLSGLTALEELTLVAWNDQNPLTGDFSSLRMLSRLKNVSLDSKYITVSLDDAAMHSSLESLRLDADISGEISSLFEITGLADICLSNWGSSTAMTCAFDSSLLNLSDLWQFNISNANFSGDLTVLNQLPELEALYLGGKYILPKIEYITDDPITVDAPMISDSVALVPNTDGYLCHGKELPSLDPNTARSITWEAPVFSDSYGINGIYTMLADGNGARHTGLFQMTNASHTKRYNIYIVQPFDMYRVAFIQDESVEADAKSGYGCITGLTPGCRYAVTVYGGDPDNTYVVNADGTLGAEYTGEEAYIDLPSLESDRITGLRNFDFTDVIDEHYLIQLFPGEEESTGSAVEDDSGLPGGPVEMPAIVYGQIDQGSKALDVILLTEPLPAEGENSMAFNIELIYEDGRPVRINGGTKLYLPFPPGMTIDECRRMRFTIRHDADDGVHWYRTENNDIKVTPHGLMIFIDSLSPFTISWEAAPTPTPTATPVPTPTPEPTATPNPDPIPKTGDNSSLPLCALLLTGSLLSMAMLRRRRRA